VQGAALAIAEDRSEGEDLPFAGSEQLLAGNLRGGVQVEATNQRRIAALILARAASRGLRSA
jgi:hypothetical protein